MLKYIKENWKQINIILALLLLFILIVRLVPLLKFGYLGYDTGIYKKYFELFFNNFGAVSNIAVLSKEPIGIYIIGGVLLSLGVPSAFLVSGFQLILGPITALLLYFLVKKVFNNNKEIGLLAVFMYSVSIIQFEVYYFSLIKTEVAMVFGLISILFLLKRSWIYLIFAFLTFLTHPFVLIVMILPIIFYFMFKNLKDTFILKSLVVLIVPCLLLYFLIPNYQNLLISVVRTTKLEVAGGSGGKFYNIWNYALFAFPGISLAIIGFKSKFVKNGNLFIFLLLFSLVWILSHAFFFNRMVAFFDFWLIPLEALGLHYLITFLVGFKQKIPIFFIMSVFVFMILFFVLGRQPSITRSEMKDVLEVKNLTEKDSIILTNESSLSPWLFGFSDRNVIYGNLFFNETGENNLWHEIFSKNGVPNDIFKEKKIYVYNKNIDNISKKYKP